MTVVVQPYESGIVDYCVVDFAVVDTDFTSLGGIISTYDPRPIVPVEIYTSAMVLSGIVEDYESFKFTQKWYEVDEWEIIINRYHTNVSQFVIGGFIRYSRDGIEHIGMIERIEKPLNFRGKGGENWRISGRGVEAVLSQRVCIYATDTDSGYHNQNVAGETAMRAYVNAECIAAADTSRNIPGLTLAADSARGSTVNYSARLQVLTDVLYDICKETGLAYGLEWSGSGLNFVFTVYEGSDVSGTVKLSPEFDNVERFQFLSSRIDMKNLLYVGGTGTDASRTVREVYDTTEPTGWSRRESFIEASDCSNNTQLDLRGASVLATTGEETVIEVDYLESNTFVYGTDFEIGDTITVVFPDVVTVVSRIISVTEEFVPSGMHVTLGIGREYPDMRSITRAMDKQTSAQLRR